MTDVGAVQAIAPPGPAVRTLTVIARQRELSLVAVMLLLGAFVAVQAPQFLSVSNLTQVTVFAAIIAIAAVGEAMVVLTRNVDLSVESVIGLVAFVVADVLAKHILPVPAAIAFGIGLGLVLGMVNGLLVAWLRVPSIVATLGTLSIYRGFAFLVAGGKQVTLTDLPAGYTDPARATVLGIVPLFLVIAVVVIIVFAVVLRQTSFGRSVYAVGSNPEAAEILGINSRVVTFAVFSLCGLLGGLAGILWGMQFGTINATAATGVTLQVIAAVVVGGVNIFGGSGTVVGAGLGAMFLAFISNALILLSLSQFWLQAIYGVVILVAVGLDAALLRRVQRSNARTRTPVSTP
ncbi:MAG TPA: ABC transporter permease [Patescibacteria group bacterium]|nr:ABC transporter permease [Patescibacteria group bacterium]